MAQITDFPTVCKYLTTNGPYASEAHMAQYLTPAQDMLELLHDNMNTIQETRGYLYISFDVEGSTYGQIVTLWYLFGARKHVFILYVYSCLDV